MAEPHVPHPHIARRKAEGAALAADEHVGFNGWLAVLITKSVGSMWCAYAFAAIALISLPDAIHQGTVAVVSWISQTFLQLVLLSVIMVGQQVLAKASDKQALQTFKDTEAVLELTSEIDKLIKVNNVLTDEIHADSGGHERRRTRHGEGRRATLSRPRASAGRVGGWRTLRRAGIAPGPQPHQIKPLR